MPTGEAYSSWQLYLLLMLLLACFLLPLDAAFQLAADGSSFWLYAALDATFLADLVVNFRTAYIDRRGVGLSMRLVSKPTLIAQRYLRGNFWADLLRAVPFDAIFRAASVERRWWVDVLKLVGLLRLTKLPRVLRSTDGYQRLRLRVSSAALQLLESIVGLTFLMHLLACLYCTVVRLELDDDVAPNGWMPEIYFLPLPEEPGYAGDGARVRQYLFSMWWTVCAATGTSVTTPQVGDVGNVGSVGCVGSVGNVGNVSTAPP